MDWKIGLVAIPVTDIDRAKASYVDQVGFHADHDYQVNRHTAVRAAHTARFSVLGRDGNRHNPDGAGLAEKACKSWSPMLRRHGKT
jgi:hypothetical protein